MKQLVAIFTNALLFAILLCNLHLNSCSKKSWGNKSVKKLSKSEVEVKPYLFPCTFDEEKLLNSTRKTPNRLHNCKRKFVIRMTVNSGGEFCSKTDGFIPIDHVIDGITGRKKRLLNPIMIRLKREKMYQLYDLQLVKTVNAEASEEVINYENTPNFTGCDTSSSHPTCGFSFFNNKIIQFSEGFCCSCDQNKNEQRQPCESQPHEQNFNDMRYAVRNQRSNRTSRAVRSNMGEESVESINILNDKNQDVTPLTVFSVEQEQIEDEEGNAANQNNLGFSGSEHQPISKINIYGLSIEKLNDNSSALDSFFSGDNVTIKNFEFEQTLDLNKDPPYTVSPLDILIDSDTDNADLNNSVNNNKIPVSPEIVKLVNSDESEFIESDMPIEVIEKFNNYDNSKCNNEQENSLDQDKLRKLLIQRIKQNKNREKNDDTGKSDPLQRDQNLLSTRVKLRDVNNRLNTKQEVESLSQSGKKGISLKLESENSELNLEIVTKKPKSLIKEEGLLGGVYCGNESENSFSYNNFTQVQLSTTVKTQVSKKSFIKNPLKFLKNYKRKNKTTTPREQSVYATFTEIMNSSCTFESIRRTTYNELCDSSSSPRMYSSTITQKDVTNTTPKTSLSVSNSGTNSTSIEYLIMKKIVPLINTVQNVKAPDKETCKKSVGSMADTDNGTYKVYVELKKKSDSKSHDPVPSLLKDSRANSFDLNNKLFSVNSDKLRKNNLVIVGSDFKAGIIKNSEKQVKNNELDFIEFPSGLSQSHGQSIQKRETPCEAQIRGGQRCSEENKKIPCNANPDTYFESAHCLRFSDLWYNVLKLINPRLENSITLKVYAKHKTPDKRICWENLSKRLPGRVGTTNEVLTDDAKTIMISYSSDDKVAFSLDCSSDYILVPQPLPRQCKNEELKAVACGGPEEYLVLKENDITFDGEDCDKAGVNYAAFARQHHRCQQEAGSCLRNQPLHFWREDKKHARAHKRGQYFLKNYLQVTEQAILQNTTSNQVVLRAPYFERYQSHVVLEINADHIEIIGDKSEGQVTEVYTDATSDKIIIVKAVITNMGIAADLFGVDFANCSSRLGPSDFDKPGKDEIPPQHRITYTATISSPLSHKRVECKLVVYNIDQEVIASRSIIIVQGHRCMCVWHCQCVCYNYPQSGLPCNPLTLKEYNQAGFPGHLPITIGSDCSTFFTVLHALLWFFIFLLLFGLIKALLGLCFPGIAVWGLWYLQPNEAKCLYAYMEPDLACYTVTHDGEGFPVHPRTYRRTVHFLPWYTEFIMNMFFFICVPRMCLCDRISQSGSSNSGFGYQPYQQSSCCRRPRHGRGRCSPGYSRCRSPCGSVCSNRRNRKFRLSAGAEDQFLNPEPQAVQDEEVAKALVEELTRSYIVFRVLSRPIGGVKSVPGAPYCVRGFFLESENGAYEFSPPSPLMQMWQMDGSPLEPPVKLDSAPFHTLYHNAREVMAAHELSPEPRGIVINCP